MASSSNIVLQTNINKNVSRQSERTVAFLSILPDKMEEYVKSYSVFRYARVSRVQTSKTKIDLENLEPGNGNKSLVNKLFWGSIWIVSIICSIMIYHYFFISKKKESANLLLQTEDDEWRNLGYACSFVDCEVVVVKYNQDFISFSPGFRSDRILPVVRMLYEAYSKIHHQLSPGDHIAAFPITDLDYIKFGNPPSGAKVYWPSLTRENLNITAPDFSFFSWLKARIYYSDGTINELRDHCEKPFVEDKLFFRGAISSPPRAILMNLSISNPDLIDAKVLLWNNDGPIANFVELWDHCDYSMLIDMGGYGFSARQKYLVHANRTLFIQDRKYWDWSAKGLEPYKHYIPVKNDLSDLLDQIQWAKDHHLEVQEMNNRRLEYADKHMRFQNAIERFGEILLQN